MFNLILFSFFLIIFIWSHLNSFFFLFCFSSKFHIIIHYIQILFITNSPISYHYAIGTHFLLYSFSIIFNASCQLIFSPYFFKIIIMETYISCVCIFYIQNSISPINKLLYPMSAENDYLSELLNIHLVYIIINYA